MAKDEKPTNGLKRLEQRLTDNAKYPSFPAYLRENFEAFSKTIARGGSDKWAKTAAWAMEEKLTGGRVITPAAVQRAYEREKTKRANSAVKIKQASSQSPREERLNASANRPAAIPSSSPDPSSVDDDDAEFQLRTLTPKRKG